MTNEIEQITIFDIGDSKMLSDTTLENKEEKTIAENIEEDTQTDTLFPYAIGDRVYIQVSCAEEEDPESYHYLKNWWKKKGVVQKVNLKPKLQYEVDFGNDTAIVYHHELSISPPTKE